MKVELKKLTCELMEIDTVLSRYKRTEILNVNIFSQTWGSTALGFGGIGGSAMTSAYTTVLECFVEHQDSKGEHHIWLVFFAGSIAYAVENPTEEFFKDLASGNMASCAEARGRY